MTTYGYIRTSRQRIQGTAGSDPEAQAHQLRQEGVPEANIYRDVGVSGGTGTNSRAGGPSTPRWSQEIFWWWWPSTGSAAAGWTSRLMAIPGWIPGNPAGAGTCPRQKATNPDTGLAPPYPCLPGDCTGWGVTSGGCLSRGSPGRLKPQSARREGPMIEPSPVPHHMTRRHDPVRLCDEQPADDDDIPATDIDALRDARAEATLCPVCQQNSHIHDYSLRPDRYQDGRRTLAHLYTVPVQYAFDGKGESCDD